MPLEGRIPLVSTVTGTCLPHSRLKARYWWRNIREPVQFAAAIREAAKLGARFFVEIGPRSTLLRHISDSLVGEADDAVVLSALEHHDQKRDPVDKIVSQALISGARLDTAAVFGPNPGAAVSLPSYPWQQTQFRFTPTTEAGSLVESGRHPFSGARTGSDSLEWYAHIDTALFSELADHRVGEEVIFPGTGFLEIAFAVASEWLRTGHVLLADFQILKPLNLSKDETREVMSRVSPGSNTIENLQPPSPVAGRLAAPFARQDAARRSESGHARGAAIRPSAQPGQGRDLPDGRRRRPALRARISLGRESRDPR